VSVPTPRTGPVLARRRFLQLTGYGVAGLTVSQFLAACGGSDSDGSSSGGSGSGTAMSVQLSWIKDAEFAPLFFADADGYLSDEDIQLDMVAGGPDIGAVEGLVAGGTTDLGIATDITTIIAAAADGNPLVVLGALYQSNLNALMSAPDNPITSVEQLVGKRMGGPQGVQVKYDAMFRLNGLEPDYTFVPVGYGPDALINGDVDVMAGFITDEVLAYEEVTGNAPTLLTFTDAGLPAYTLPIFTTTSFLEENRDSLKGLLRALTKGFDDFAADPDRAGELAAEYGADAGLQVEEEQRKAAAYLPLASSATTEANGWMYIDAEFLGGDVYRGMEAAGLATVPVEDVLDMSLLDEINAE
jgi:ABC-type nitrate/sulfonate/bicarbonate transport system substrate-binding protein